MGPVEEVMSAEPAGRARRKRLRLALLAVPLLLAELGGAGCRSPGVDMESGETSANRGTEAPSPEADPEMREVDELARQYWKRFNEHDLDAVLTLMTPSYGVSRRSDLKSEMGRLRLFGVTLGVRFDAPPRRTGPNEASAEAIVSTPVGHRDVLMRFVRPGSGGEWRIDFAEEVDE